MGKGGNVRRLKMLVLVCSMTVIHAMAADVYRWTDKNGVVNYSDQSPTDKAANVQQRDLSLNVIDGQGSYAMDNVSKQHPVTLYSTECGPVCDNARDLLKQRGVPFTYKDPMTDKAAAKAIGQGKTGNFRLPLLKIGKKTLKGFSAQQWADALDEAGYPKHASPDDIRHPPEAPVAPPPPPPSNPFFTR